MSEGLKDCWQYGKRNILRQASAADVEERAQQYRAEGWVGFEENVYPSQRVTRQ